MDRYWHWKHCSLWSMVILVLLIAANQLVNARPTNLIRGSIVPNWPYADKINNQYEGFVVDLLDLIADRIGFEYCLHSPTQGTYGSVQPDGTVNGMIGEVYRNEADFAVGDLEVTDSRRRYVDFTEPFIENQLAAIVRKDNPQMQRFRTLEDMINFNDPLTRGQQTQPSSEQQNTNAQHQNQPIIYGIVQNSAIENFFQKSLDPTARRIHEWIDKNKDRSLARTANDGVDRVFRDSHYAFLVESTFAEDVIGQNCNLTMLPDTQGMYPRNFAIALSRGSPFTQRFNVAIRELKHSGQIDHLRQKYWTNYCNKSLLEDIHKRLPSPPTTPPHSSAYPGQPPFRWPTQQQSEQHHSHQWPDPRQDPRLQQSRQQEDSRLQDPRFQDSRQQEAYHQQWLEHQRQLQLQQQRPPTPYPSERDQRPPPSSSYPDPRQQDSRFRYVSPPSAFGPEQMRGDQQYNPRNADPRQDFRFSSDPKYNQQQHDSRYPDPLGQRVGPSSDFHGHHLPDHKAGGTPLSSHSGASYQDPRKQYEEQLRQYQQQYGLGASGRIGGQHPQQYGQDSREGGEQQQPKPEREWPPRHWPTTNYPLNQHNQPEWPETTNNVAAKEPVTNDQKEQSPTNNRQPPPESPNELKMQ